MAKHMFRLSVPAFLLGLILYPAGGLQALGLGEARVESWLGQPLDVTVGLLDVDRDEAESVRVVPASLADFERLGIPSEALGLGLEVEVDRRATPPQVRVRSRHSANDPIVRLLLDARWSSGRVLREYTLFLDPPTTPSAPPVVETGAKSSRPDAARPVADPIPSREAASRPARAQETEAGSSAPDDANGRLAGISDDFVAVASGDTLWSIAYDWRPSSSMSMDQVMLAIFNLNPDAFIDGNINNLRSSAQLEMPDVDDIESIGRASARRQVSEHMSRWQPAASGEVPVVSEAALPDTPDPVSAPEPKPEPEEADASAGESDAAQAAGEDYRLDVVPPDEDGFSEGTAVAEDELDRVADSLAELKEEAAAEGLDGEAFDDHASEIRTALDQRDMAGLAVAEESLAELQARLREMREARALEEEAVEPDVAGSDDLVADYMRELEDEFDISSGDQPAQADSDADEPADDEEIAGQPAAGQPMTVTKTSASSSDSGG
ncbi:MAG TPA: FimV/HubP family polar landmark protein, partial [Wenzhouxiangella sp.]|nr:FimV/HubP family polar landmark protein [Wenzhouxiangella sp.]